MNIVGVIPARYKSTRYPGKPLVKILDKPMVIWVAQLTAKAMGKENVYVATEDERIKKAVEDYGYNAIMTGDDAITGTDRLWQAAQQIEADIYVNVQGDEPLVNPDDINKIVDVKVNNLHEVVNGMCRLNEFEDPSNVNIPKVIFTEDKRLVYISRMAIPGVKNVKNFPRNYWKQVCIYAFTFNELKKFGEYGKKSYLESFEDVEILRFFEFNTPVRMVETSGNSIAVDVPSDVEVVESEMRERGVS